MQQGICCFETFPHAITCHLRNGEAKARQKRPQRTALLAQAGINTEPLTSIDLIDAALCALTAHRFASGAPCIAFGEPDTGPIPIWICWSPCRMIGWPFILGLWKPMPWAANWPITGSLAPCPLVCSITWEACCHERGRNPR
jgi:hypothetical protein